MYMFFEEHGLIRDEKKEKKNSCTGATVKKCPLIEDLMKLQRQQARKKRPATFFR